MPRICPRVYRPVVINGIKYGNKCEARRAQREIKGEGRMSDFFRKILGRPRRGRNLPPAQVLPTEPQPQPSAPGEEEIIPQTSHEERAQEYQRHLRRMNGRISYLKTNGYSEFDAKKKLINEVLSRANLDEINDLLDFIEIRERQFPPHPQATSVFKGTILEHGAIPEIVEESQQNPQEAILPEGAPLSVPINPDKLERIRSEFIDKASTLMLTDGTSNFVDLFRRLEQGLTDIEEIQAYQLFRDELLTPGNNLAREISRAYKRKRGPLVLQGPAAQN